MVTIEEIAVLIAGKLRGRLPAGTTLDASTRIEDLPLSSLQLADVVFKLEEDHGIELDAGRAADIKTLGELTALANDPLQVVAAGAVAVEDELGGEGGGPDDR
jgi:acyl carrier protein